MADEAKDKLVNLEDLKAYADTVNDATTGINLLRGTRDFYHGSDKYETRSDPPVVHDTIYMTDGWGSGLYYREGRFADKKSDDGFSYIEFTGEKNPNGDICILYSNCIDCTDYNIVPGTKLTVSFEIMIKDATGLSFSDTGVQVACKSKDDADLSNYISPSGFYVLTNMDITSSNVKIGEWYKFSRTYTFNENIDPEGFITVRLRSKSTGGVVCWRKLKLEFGAINNPIWSPSPFDIAQATDVPELPISIENGGTGATTAKGAQYNLLKDAEELENAISDTSMFFMRRNNASATISNGIMVWRKAPLVWDWIASKIKSVFGFDSDNKLPASKITGTIPISNGGTGQTTALNAITALGGRSIASIGTNIPNNSDLDDYKTPGTFYVGSSDAAKTITNTPTTLSGYKLTVEQGYQSSRIIQTAEYTEAGNVNEWQRTYVSSAWSAWHVSPKSGSTVYYATCDTAAATAAKVATVSNDFFKLRTGDIVVVRYTNSNTASTPTLNVNSTGAKSIYYNTSVYTGTSTTIGGTANGYISYMYDGTYWVWMGHSLDSNTTYTNMTLGNGYGTCATAAATAAKVVTLANYGLLTGGMISVKFTYAVPANATLNVNSKGAKNIFYKGAKITAGIIQAGDLATFIYDGTQYQLIAVDRAELVTTADIDKMFAGTYTAATNVKLVDDSAALYTINKIKEL